MYFQVGSSATLGTRTAFRGTIIANTSITLVTGASIVCGRAIALNGAVTMDDNRISNDCVGGSVSTIPEPSTLALLLGPFGVALVAFRRRRRRSPPCSVAPLSVGCAV